ncbi:hypothetical protein [Nocardiopsis alborubida]|uniref:Transferase n=1 Tax=Nocardiopsis alborubida TaxID=146802 RepID=A0A7X6M9Z3_9ACTN|nr:hypothetical protein [Nocardiopsis alborubida]NKY97392.1 hypothetical protein [Nocardiopsis alborubida]
MAHSGTVARLAARMLERRHVTRAGVARISVLGAVGAAVWFSRADTVGGLAGSAFLGAVLFCDAVRERMRADRRDALTLWLVAMLSQLREYAVYLGLAAGAVAAGAGGAWGWAAGALVALALRESLLASGSAPALPGQGPGRRRPPPPAQRPAGGLLGGLAPRPPQGPRTSDPGLTARLFGATVVDGPTGGSRPARAPAGASANGTAVNGPAVNGIRVNGAEVNGAVRYGGPLCGSSEEGASPNGVSPDGASAGNRTDGRAAGGADTGTDGRADRPVPPPLRRIADFPQPVRFLAIAVTATLWDARVAFVTLVVGCVVAATAQLADPARSRR